MYFDNYPEAYAAALTSHSSRVKDVLPRTCSVIVYIIIGRKTFRACARSSPQAPRPFLPSLSKGLGTRLKEMFVEIPFLVTRP